MTQEMVLQESEDEKRQCFICLRTFGPSDEIHLVSTKNKVVEICENCWTRFEYGKPKE